MCYGNQWQQILHQECLSFLQHTAALSISSALYDYKPELVGYADVAREYKQGLLRNAIIMLDCCWTILDFGKAIAHGRTAGITEIQNKNLGYQAYLLNMHIAIKLA